MDETEFWALVDGTRLAAGHDPDLHAELLVERLTELDPEAVQDFARHFEARFGRAYRWDLWGAAWLLLDGADEDTFENFRCWLISRGRRVFEGALADPDALAELLPDFDGGREGEAEEFGYAAFDAYEQLTGDELPDLGLGEPGNEPLGAALDLADGAALAAAYPRLWARFGPGAGRPTGPGEASDGWSDTVPGGAPGGWPGEPSGGRSGGGWGGVSGGLSGEVAEEHSGEPSDRWAADRPGAADAPGIAGGPAPV